MANIAKSVYETQLGIMKNALKLGEFKFGGKDSDQFKFFKEQIMNFHYDALKRFFIDGVKEGVFEKCICGANLRQGWKICESCAGSGYRDKK